VGDVFEIAKIISRYKLEAWDLTVCNRFIGFGILVSDRSLKTQKNKFWVS